MSSEDQTQSLTVSDAIDFSKKIISAGSYILRNVNPQNGQPTINLNSVQPCEFLLPATHVINLSRSYLNFDFLLVDGGAVHQRAHSGFLAPIDGIILSTASGVRLVELNEVQHYTKLVWRAETNQSDFLTNPCHSSGSLTVAAVTEVGQLFNRTRAANANAAAGAPLPTDNTAGAYLASGSYIVSNERVTAAGAAVAARTYASASDDYTAVQTMIVQPVVGDGAGAGALGVKVRLPLKMLYGSLFAVDKDLYFGGEQLTLTVRFAPGSTWGFTSAGATGTVDLTTTTNINLTSAPTISSVALRVAVETNPAISEPLKARVLSKGISMITPFVYSYKANGSVTAVDTNTFIRKLNRGHGERCLRMIVGIFSAQEIAGNFCNLYNYGGAKWTQYRSFLDSKPISDDNLLMSDFSAYQWNMEKFRGSCIKDGKDWAQQPVIIEDFSGVKHACDYPETDNMESGIDLATEREYAFQFTSVYPSLNVYIYAVTQKTLRITGSGISCM